MSEEKGNTSLPQKEISRTFVPRSPQHMASPGFMTENRFNAGNILPVQQEKIVEIIKEKPQVSALIGRHQQWMAQEVTLMARKILRDTIQKYLHNAAHFSMSTRDEKLIMVTTAMAQALILVEKEIYETDKFIQNIAQ